jgi:hypothetical protein
LTHYIKVFCRKPKISIAGFSGKAFMDFEYSAKVAELRAQVAEFMT